MTPGAIPPAGSALGAANADYRYLISLRRLFARLVQSDVDLPGFPGFSILVEIGAFDVES
jgi:hypothetical protein